MIEENLKRGVALEAYTTFHIGGAADLFIEAATPEMLREALCYARARGIPTFLLGGGSNVLIDDRGIRGLVIRNGCVKYSFEGSNVHAESGVSLDTLVRESAKRELGGMECLAGIPGTLGGAIYGNAGAYGKSIHSLIESARIITGDGEEKVVNNDFFKFRYRWSILKEIKAVVLDATLRLSSCDSPAISGEIERITLERCGKHPRDVGTCGCFFKNVESPEPGASRISAGKLLEAVGAKGMRVGGACVSDKHANFIINPGSATARDVMELATILKKRVASEFNIELEEEVQIIGENI